MDAENGEPIIGATIYVKGTSTGTTTNLDGQFELKADQNAIIVFAYIGYVEQEVAAASQMNVTLAEEAQLLDDIVVIGYGAVRKKELTGAVAQVKSEDISKLNASDLGNALQGMVSGVSVTAESGAPGAGSTILIRGVTSINGDNTPLYVVDGVPQEGDPGLSPNEVETIDILKDAASCAIYGTRGAAGVILVTTKRGVAGDLKVNASARYGVQQIVSTDYLMNATEQNYFNMAYARTTSGSYDDAIILDLYKVPSYFQNDTNLLDQIFINNAATQNYSIDLSGGANGLTYSAMAGFYDQGGSIINSDYNRFNSRVNLGYSKDKFTFGVNAGFNLEETSYSPSGILLQAIRYYPSQPYIETDDSFDTAGGEEQNRIGYILQSFFATDKQEMTSVFGNFNAGYSITDNLSINGRYSVNRSNGYRHQFVPYKEIINNTTNEVISNEEDSYVAMRSLNSKSATWDFGAQYKNSFDKHNLTAFVGISGERYQYVGFYAYKEGVLNNEIDVLNGASINPSASSDTTYDNTLFGSIARLQYDWDSRYLFSASIRCDGSSKFSADNRWGYFPSASAAWNISDEPFFEPLTDAVNNLKLRLSYGTTGNQNFSAYSFISTVTSGYDYTTGTGATESLGLGSTQDSYSNAEVKWETSKQYNIGVDLGLFDNKLTFTAEYYSTQKEDMLFPVTLPSSTGATTQLITNIGNMVNSGYEFSAQYRTHIGKVNITTNATISSNSNQITYVNGDGSRISAYEWGLISGAADVSQVTYIAEGYEAGAFFLYPTNGIINTEEKLAAYQEIVPTAQMGDLIYVDSDEDGQITDNDRVYSGSGMPDIEIGLNTQIAYAGFDLYINLYSALGHKIMNGSRATAFGYGRHKDLVGQYSEVNTDSVIPTYRGDLKSHPNYRADTDVWLEDGSYVRMKNITLGYSLPEPILKKLNVRKLRPYISIQNPFTWTNYTGYDPEIGGSIATRGMDMGNYPSFTIYTAGLDLSF